MRNSGLEETQAGIKIAGRNINKIENYKRRGKIKGKKGKKIQKYLQNKSKLKNNKWFS